MRPQKHRFCRIERVKPRFPDERESLYDTWSKEFLEAGKQRLAGDTARQATSPDVKELRSETVALKEVVADLTLENRSSGGIDPPDQFLICETACKSDLPLF